MRTLEVGPERVERWVVGFTARHGDPQWSTDGATVVLTAGDGAVARLDSWADEKATGVVASPNRLGAWAEPPEVLGLVLLRRGGYAVGLARGAELASHKCGTRYVQSRTAAGGWSQQRFARRRSNQADALVGAVADHVGRLVVPGRPQAMVLGGDKALVRTLLEDARLAPLGELDRRGLYDLPDPRLTVLQRALRRGRAVRIGLTEPDAR